MHRRHMTPINENEHRTSLNTPHHCNVCDPMINGRRRRLACALNGVIQRFHIIEYTFINDVYFCMCRIIQVHINEMHVIEHLKRLIHILYQLLIMAVELVVKLLIIDIGIYCILNNSEENVLKYFF